MERHAVENASVSNMRCSCCTIRDEEGGGGGITFGEDYFGGLCTDPTVGHITKHLVKGVLNARMCRPHHPIRIFKSGDDGGAEPLALHSRQLN